MRSDASVRPCGYANENPHDTHWARCRDARLSVAVRAATGSAPPRASEATLQRALDRVVAGGGSRRGAAVRDNGRMILTSGYGN
jgi:hypothetical protein